VRKLITKFRKISQENRAAAQNNPNAPIPPAASVIPTQQTSSPSKAQTTVPPIITEPTDSSPTTNTASSTAQHLNLPPPSTVKTRDKLETISERIETQASQVSQITSLNQSPPLHRPPKSSKWKWLKTGSTGPETDSPPPRGTVPTIKPPSQQQLLNPFDSNITDEDTLGKTSDGNERRLSIPLSLFIPRIAHREGAKISDEGSDDSVSIFMKIF
jgi:hypothetical protein